MPTLAKQRSMKHLKKEGWTVADVEKWIPPRGKMKFGVRKDVWGFGDILACRKFADPYETFPCQAPRYKGKGETALIQTFPLARWNDHVVKLAGLKEVGDWKAAGNRIFLHGWALKPKDGVRGAKKVWTLREAEV